MLLDSYREQLRLGGNHTKLLVLIMFPLLLGRNSAGISRHVTSMKE